MKRYTPVVAFDPYLMRGHDEDAAAIASFAEMVEDSEDGEWYSAAEVDAFLRRLADLVGASDKELCDLAAFLAAAFAPRETRHPDGDGGSVGGGGHTC